MPLTVCIYPPYTKPLLSRHCTVPWNIDTKVETLRYSWVCGEVFTVEICIERQGEISRRWWEDRRGEDRALCCGSCLIRQHYRRRYSTPTLRCGIVPLVGSLSALFYHSLSHLFGISSTLTALYNIICLRFKMHIYRNHCTLWSCWVAAVNCIFHKQYSLWTVDEVIYIIMKSGLTKMQC